MSKIEAAPEASTEFDDLPMRAGLGQFRQPTDEYLQYAKQLGVKDVNLNFYIESPDDMDEIALQGEDEWSYKQLRSLREQVEEADLRLTAIENLPAYHYDDILFDREGREKQLEHVKNSLRNMGKAGIPILGYHWNATKHSRTAKETLRGGAKGTSFKLDEYMGELVGGREFTEEEFWDNYRSFLEEVMPVAEEAGVKLALHPNDPPVEYLDGCPCLFRNLENFKRAMEMVSSDNHGLELCLGCWSEMGEDVEEVIRYFGERDQIFYVHFRDVEGTVPEFNETFVDQGNYDGYAAMKALYESGFAGMIITDHVPEVIGDTDWGHRGRAYSLGYIKGLLDAVTHD